MASKNYATQAAGWSQANQRDYAVFYDQHKSVQFPIGRPWWAVVERPAEGAAMPMPVGELQPGDGGEFHWNAPWIPDAKYINASIGKAVPGRTMQEHRFRIDYMAMITDRKAALREYYDRAVLEAIGQGWDAPDFGAPITYRLRAIVGVPPLSPKIPEAALAEDPWILGFTTKENETLARLLELGMGTEHIATASQSEAKGDRLAEMEALLKAQSDQMAALLARESDRESERQSKVDARMAKARAGRKSSTVHAG